MSAELRLFAVPRLPEIEAGDDLAELICSRVALRDGDLVVVTSKAVSKAEGRVVEGDRFEVAAAQPGRVVACRGRTTIVRTDHGLVLAAAGADTSNVALGRVVLLPVDPDASARRLRAAIAAWCAVNIAVVITDTAGRPWRAGQTDIAVGCAGISPLRDYAGTRDAFGNDLEVTAPALADEVAAAADLVKGKLGGTPVAVLRASGIAVLPAGADGPGAAALVRPPAEDLFALGAREAVIAAVTRSDPEAMAAFPPDSQPLAELVDGLARIAGQRLDPASARLASTAGTALVLVEGLLRSSHRGVEQTLELGSAAERLRALLVAHGQVATAEPLPPSVEDGTGSPPSWQVVLRFSVRRDQG